MARRTFVDTELGQVHVSEHGGGASTVVLLHQTPRSGDEFAEVAPRLAADHRVLVVDTPGYGASDRPDSCPDVADYVAALVAVLDALGAARAHFVGHHTGAVLAMELAAGHADRVCRLVLSGPVYIDQGTRDFFGTIFEQWHAQPDGGHLAEKWERFMGWTGDHALAQRIITDLFRAGETSEFGHFAIARYRMEDRIDLVRAPALLLFGERDPFNDPEKAAILEARLPDSRAKTLPGGVFMPNEIPEQYATAVLDWLAP